MQQFIEAEIDKVGPTVISYAATSEAARKCGRAFLYQRYPVTEEGIEMRNSVADHLAKGDNVWLRRQVGIGGIPTVECSNPRYWQPLILTAGDQQRIVADLIVIQTSSGCVRRCLHCCVDAPLQIEFMPFPGVEKIAEAAKSHESTILQQWEQWARIDKTGLPENRLRRLYNQLFKDQSLGIAHPALSFDRGFPDSLFDLRFPRTNWFDSDPLNYRDTSFLHQDGSPANYGDVVRVVATYIRPVEITTGGWLLKDQGGAASAKALVALYRQNPYLFFDGVTISVNPYNRQVRQNPDVYLEEMKAVIAGLQEIQPIKGESGACLGKSVIKIFYDQIDSYFDQIYQRRVALPLRRFIKDLGSPIEVKNHCQISYFSGRARQFRRKGQGHNRDISNCFPGYLIAPSGIVKYSPWSWGEEFPNSSALFKKVREGVRPSPTGLKAFPLAATDRRSVSL